MYKIFEKQKAEEEKRIALWLNDNVWDLNNLNK